MVTVVLGDIGFNANGRNRSFPETKLSGSGNATALRRESPS
jgi:hypothetical protein